MALAWPGGYSSDSTLAWEPTYATGAALEKAKRPKKKKEPILLTFLLLKFKDGQKEPTEVNTKD